MGCFFFFARVKYWKAICTFLNRLPLVEFHTKIPIIYDLIMWILVNVNRKILLLLHQTPLMPRSGVSGDQI